MPSVAGVFTAATIDDSAGSSGYHFDPVTIANVFATDGTPQTYIIELTPVDALGTSDTVILSGGTASVPLGMNIDGIEITIRKAKTNASASVKDVSVVLVRAGVPEATNKASIAEYPTSYTDVVYGSSVDLWGAAWTRADVMDSGFGVAVSAGTLFNPPFTGDRPYFDSIIYTIHYSAAPGQVSATTDQYFFDGGTYHRSPGNPTGAQEAPMRGDRPPVQPYMGLPTPALVERTFTEFLQVEDDE